LGRCAERQASQHEGSRSFMAYRQLKKRRQNDGSRKQVDRLESHQELAKNNSLQRAKCNGRVQKNSNTRAMRGVCLQVRRLFQAIRATCRVGSSHIRRSRLIIEEWGRTRERDNVPPPSPTREQQTRTKGTKAIC
jgi:hypothetical protein